MIAVAAFAQLAIAQLPDFSSASTSTSTARGAVGWPDDWSDRPPGFFHTPQDLARRLREQQNNVLSRKWFDSLLNAQDELDRKAVQAPAAQRKTLEKAAASARRVIHQFEASLYLPPNILGIVMAFDEAASAQRAAQAAQKARKAIRVAEERSAMEQAYDAVDISEHPALSVAYDAISDADEDRITASIKEKYGR